MSRPDAALLIVSAADRDPYVVMESQDRQGEVENDWMPYLAKPVLYPIEDFVADLLLLPNVMAAHGNNVDFYRQKGISHVALWPSSQQYETVLRFGPDYSFGLGIVLFYRLVTDRLHLMHCGAEADMVANWIEKMQGEWALNAGVGFQKESSTHH